MNAQIAEKAVLPANFLMRLRGTNRNAFVAVDTVLRIKMELFFPGNGLRIMAPPAFERAALHEESGAEARAVVNGHPRRVEHQRCFHCVGLSVTVRTALPQW